ncbi:unnamed protein product, partial [Ectocarpus fasciculatus]
MQVAQVIDAPAKAGATIGQRDVAGGSPRHSAAFLGHLEAALALLRNGAEVNVTNKNKRTPLFTVVECPGRDHAAEMVDLLLRWGDDEGLTD